MRIGIDVNGVLRDTVLKFDQLYTKHLIEREQDVFLGQTFELDMSGNTELIESSENNFEYAKISEVTSLDFQKHYSFKNEEELFGFMFEEYTMELFGHAPSSEMTTFNILNDLYFKIRDKNDLIIVSSEIGKSKPSTLFFLSKFGCLLERIFFFSEVTKNSMWNEIDILLTADPTLLLEVPDGKIVVKYKTSYNKHLSSELEIQSLSEFDEILKTIEQNVI